MNEYQVSIWYTIGHEELRVLLANEIFEAKSEEEAIIKAGSLNVVVQARNNGWKLTAAAEKIAWRTCDED